MEKHAVALVVNDVVSACTGFLVQNTAQDSKLSCSEIACHLVH